MNLIDPEDGAPLAAPAPHARASSEQEPALATRPFSPREEAGGLAQQLVDFVAPLLAEGDGSPEQEQNILELGRVCWQMALQDPETRAERLREVEAVLCSTEEEREALRALVESMIERHRALFPWLHQGLSL
jgi:hypothetical protein